MQFSSLFGAKLLYSSPDWRGWISNPLDPKSMIQKKKHQQLGVRSETWNISDHEIRCRIPRWNNPKLDTSRCGHWNPCVRSCHLEMFEWWICLDIYIYIQASLTKSNPSWYNIMSMKDVLHHFTWIISGVLLVSQLVSWISEPSTVTPRWIQCLNPTRGSWRILNFEQHGHMKGEQWRLPTLGSDLKKKTKKNKCSKLLGCLFQTVISYKYSMYGMVQHHLTYIYPIIYTTLQV